MATTDLNAAFDYLYLKEFLKEKYLPKHLFFFTKADHASMNSGLIQRDRLMEIIVAHISGKYEMDSQAGWDFTDHTDMKTVTINMRASVSKPSVLITKIKNKVGSLRVIALDPITQSFRFYFIWDFESVRDYNRIEFIVDSNSKYINGENGIEVSSIEELAKIDAKFRG